MNVENALPLPPDHAERIARAKLSLEGLSLGDAFGERFFCPLTLAKSWIKKRRPPDGPWCYTDDTVMARSIVATLDRFGYVEPEDLAWRFGKEYIANPARGYGSTAHSILRAIGVGEPWREASQAAFNGNGSMGNGGAMRSAPIGAYFADNYDAVVENARASAIVTHAHPDGQAGAVAIAVAAAFASSIQGNFDDHCRKRLLSTAFERTPAGETRDGIAKAIELPLDSAITTAVDVLGNGRNVISSDTVPFTLWMAARQLDDYREAIWQTVSGLGDRDTTCAIVGGIVALAVGCDGLPKDWLEERERL